MMWSYPSTHLKTFHPQGYGLLQQPETANLVQVLPVLLSLDVLLGNWRARCHNWRQFENHTNSTPLKFTSFWHLFTAGGFGGGGTGGHHAWGTTAGFGGVQAFSIFCFTTQGRHRPWVIVRRRHHVEPQSSCLSGHLHSWLLKLVCWSHNSPHLWGHIGHPHLHESRICLHLLPLFFGSHFSQGFLFCWGGLFRDFFLTFCVFFTGHFEEKRL